MAGLNLENLKKYRNEILKAETVSLLALWDKVDPNQQNKADINLDKKSLSDWENDIKGKKIKILEEEFELWSYFLNNWREWRRRQDKKYLLEVLYGVGESLNSGIDKGSPKDDIKVEPQYSRWLSNPFGSFKNRIIYLSEIEDSINNKICDLKNSITNILGSNNLDWEKFKSIREKFKNFFAGLLSDDRFPINDVSLWEQAYMATTMFKASLSEYILKNNNIQSLPKRMDVRWRILGIQYDKLGLAEKGYKPQQILWYRDKAREIDDEVKKLLEYEYPIGNEIYRDETGVYFLVGEGLGDDLNDDSNLARLKRDLKEIEEKILNIFKEKSFDEFYPAIFLTKASRGLMNLCYLLENAKENFLKADWSKKEIDICIEKSESGRAKGICQVCGQRLVFKSDRLDEDKNICDTCYKEKTQGRIDKWLEDTSKETIWMDELKDKNDGVALVTMKFELHDWLNGDMLNSLLVREENFKNLKSDLNTLLAEVKKYYTNFLNSSNKNLKSFNSFGSLNSIKSFVELFDKHGIQTPYEKVKKKIINLLREKNNLPPDSEDIMILDLFNRNFFHFLNVEGTI
ncbi:CRISPR-associated protein, Csx11 family [Thermoanaerobacter kivui]|uniref:CRISPR-associated protein, Csx11 family n=1 Tax=Thermoanaerobacter kivui TaxID=2325 RepID=A0A097AU11_THEKI|nr:CRISPR-associated protein Csx11 [Thermoanaerobacter kivui]AIS53304.1 CRISPR-associated protein, Csx11 family [Thermoanaerobacter kivui]